MILAVKRPSCARTSCQPMGSSTFGQMIEELVADEVSKKENATQASDSSDKIPHTTIMEPRSRTRASSSGGLAPWKLHAGSTRGDGRRPWRLAVCVCVCWQRCSEPAGSSCEIRSGVPLSTVTWRICCILSACEGMLHSFSLWSQTTGRLLLSRASGGLEGRRWAWHAPGGGMSAVLTSHRWSSPTRPAHTHAHHAQTNVASSTKNIGLPRRARRAGGNSVSRRSDRADGRGQTPALHGAQAFAHTVCPAQVGPGSSSGGVRVQMYAVTAWARAHARANVATDVAAFAGAPAPAAAQAPLDRRQQ